MTKYRHLFLRSEYQIALHNYRRARRRGDSADAQRWLKAADMHLRVANRFHDGVYKSRVRDRELAAADLANETPKQEAKIDPFAQRRQLDELERQIEAHFAEEARRMSQSDGEATSGS